MKLFHPASGMMDLEEAMQAKGWWKQ